MLDIPFHSAKRLASMIRNRQIGCSELLELYLARVEKYNPSLNAIITTDIEHARKRARAADVALKKGKPWGVLHGLPMTVKESFNVVGMPTTWGIPNLKNNVPTTNAIAVQRLLDAGAVIFGKTNVPIHLADTQSFNAIYGTTNNPWDKSLVPGGSSGGAAAALAAGLTSLEIGSDIGSSIRNPAHYCGVYGHKPTYGICTPRGHALPGVVAPADISVIDPLARSADDLAVALSVIAGPDEVDSVGWRLTLPAPKRRKLSQFKVAVMADHPDAEVDRGVKDRIQAVVEFLLRKKAKVTDRARPDIDTTEVQRVYITMLRAATSTRLPLEIFEKNLAMARTLHPDDDSYLARQTRGNTILHRNWLELNNIRHAMRLKWAEFFKDYDLFLCPVASSAAWPHDHQGERHERVITVNGKRVPTTDQFFWAGYSGLFFLPASVAPIGFTRDGLPVGLQIVGPQYADRTCIEFARLLEREFHGFIPPAGYS
jgi:amidase